MAKTKTVTSAPVDSAPVDSAPSTSALVATMTAISNAVNVATTAQPVKRAAIEYVNGVNPLAPANALPVTLGGAPWSGKLPATNPANRGSVGRVKNSTLTIGNGKGPKVGHNVVMFGAIVEALANGPQESDVLAGVAGSGGAAFVAYAVKNGWLVTV